MGFIKFNRTPKHQRFNYVPRYYDEAKEDLAARVRQVSDVGDPELSKARIKSGLRRKYSGRNIDTSGAVRKRNIRLLIIIVSLSVITYLFLQSEGLSRMLETFVN